MDIDGVPVAGHGAGYVQDKDGTYVFFEVTPFVGEVKENEERLGSSDSYFPTKGMVDKLKPGSNGIVGAKIERFKTKEEMLKAKAGQYEYYWQFDTTKEQDAAILNTVYHEGMKFADYTIPGNHCGLFAETCLYANPGNGLFSKDEGITKNANFGSGIAWVWMYLNSGILGQQSPSAIGMRLGICYKGKLSKM